MRITSGRLAFGVIDGGTEHSAALWISHKFCEPTFTGSRILPTRMTKRKRINFIITRIGGIYHCTTSVTTLGTPHLTAHPF